MLLTNVSLNQMVCIKRIIGNDKTKRTLSHLGISEGMTCKVISKGRVQIMIEIDGKHTPLDLGLSLKISVVEG